jgi:hypothetical protein
MRISVAICAAAFLFAVLPSEAVAIPGHEAKLNAEINGLRQQVRELAIKLEDQTAATSSQADAFNSDAVAISAAAGLSILLVTLGGIAAAVLGYQAIQRQAKEHIEQRVDAAITAHGEQIFQQEAGALHERWETKFANLYGRIKKLDV